jgi:hypothetical protein
MLLDQARAVMARLLLPVAIIIMVAVTDGHTETKVGETHLPAVNWKKALHYLGTGVPGFLRDYYIILFCLENPGLARYLYLMVNYFQGPNEQRTQRSLKGSSTTKSSRSIKRK